MARETEPRIEEIREGQRKIFLAYLGFYHISPETPAAAAVLWDIEHDRISAFEAHSIKLTDGTTFMVTTLTFTRWEFRNRAYGDNETRTTLEELAALGFQAAVPIEGIEGARPHIVFVGHGIPGLS